MEQFFHFHQHKTLVYRASHPLTPEIGSTPTPEKEKWKRMDGWMMLLLNLSVLILVNAELIYYYFFVFLMIY